MKGGKLPITAVLNARDWRTDDLGGAGQCRYPVGKARNSTRCHIKKKKKVLLS